ncbi:MAG: LacI family transcriptional regulator [Microbacteriaceae bacterium]|nr:MAG: LacI family transcriptional regulator [Microbacteriaceae bacterium]
MARRITLKDVSARAGVSTYTVSQALAGKAGVSDETREMVIRTADEMGYVTNVLAANLKGQTSSTVGVMTASGRNQYYSMLVQGIDGVLQQYGLHAVTNDAMRGGVYNAELERESVSALLQQRVALIVATYSLGESSLRAIREWDIPLVFVDSLPPAAAEPCPFVGCDNRLAGELVAEHLAGLGHRNAVFLGFPADWNTRLPREAGFRDAASRLGMSVTTVESENTAEGAYAAMRGHLAEVGSGSFDAIYASNTPLLHGVLRALRDEGLSVPESVSVVGFDEFEWAELLSPSVTVVDQHIEQIGREAGRLIAEIVTEGREVTEHLAIRPDLIIRQSTAPRH